MKFDFSPWIYDGNVKSIDEYEGFVYVIFDKEENKMYVGQKKLWKIAKKKPGKYKLDENGKYIKDKKGKRVVWERTTKTHTKVESDWRTYNSSSPILKEMIPKNKDRYEKAIIKLCTNKTTMNAVETHILLEAYLNGVWQFYYNECINCRMRINKG